MDGFVLDDFLENIGRALPVDASRDQKAAVEPGAEEVLEIQVGPTEGRIVLEQLEQAGTHLHQFAGGAGNPVDAAQQLLSLGLGGLQQHAEVLRRPVVLIFCDRHLQPLGVDVHLLGEIVEELDFRLRREFAEAGQDLLPHGVGRPLARRGDESLAERGDRSAVALDAGEAGPFEQG